MGTQLSPRKGAQQPPLSCPRLLWPNGWMDQDETWHAGSVRPWPHCSDGDPAPPLPKGHSPQFSAHICCSQMAGWIKMPLGMEVGLNPGDFVLDGTQPPSPKRGPQIFGHVYCGQTAGWIKMALDMEVGLSSGDFVRWEPSPRPKKGAEQPPNFRPISIAAKRLHGSRCHLVRR